MYSASPPMPSWLIFVMCVNHIHRPTFEIYYYSSWFVTHSIQSNDTNILFLSYSLCVFALFWLCYLRHVYKRRQTPNGKYVYNFVDTVVVNRNIRLDWVDHTWIYNVSTHLVYLHLIRFFVTSFEEWNDNIR